MVFHLRFIIFSVFLLPASLAAQGYSINGLSDNTLLIGLQNLLKISHVTREDSLHLEVFRPITAKKVGRDQFMLRVSAPKEDALIIVKNRNVIIDTIHVNIKRTTLRQHIVTRDFGLIKSGTFPIEVIKSIQSISVNTNIPGNLELPVLGYNIEIYNEKEILFTGTMKGRNLDQPEIIKAISKLKRNGVVDIKKIFTRTPWDDGKQPKRVILRVK